MKKIGLILAVLSLSGATVAQNNPYDRYAPGNMYKRVPSQIEFVSPTHDFGTIKEVNGIVSHVFQFKNVSDQPFAIGSVGSSCGCTTPEYTKTPIAPGKTGSLTIHFDPTNRPGRFEKTVIIIPSTGHRVESRLVIKGNVIPRPRTVEDDYPIYLGGGLRITDKAPDLDPVSIGGTDTIRIGTANIYPTPINVEARLDSALKIGRVRAIPQTLQAGQRGVVEVLIDGYKCSDYGRLEGRVMVGVEGDAAARDSVLIRTFVVDDFSQVAKEDSTLLYPAANIAPTYFHFGLREANDTTISQAFNITNRGSQPLIIRKIITSSPRVSYSIGKLEIAKNKAVDLEIRIDAQGITPKPTEEFVRHYETVWLITNDPFDPVRTIRLAVSVPGPNYRR